ncbi:MAG: acetoacetate--CoA ligase [Sulfobacillus thermotolerans]|nr:acetoacetate--CoA ligase [Sulfobacillus thermotolerans]
MDGLERGRVLWTPSPNQIEKAKVTQFEEWLRVHKNLTFSQYQDLWQWSVDHLEEFWAAVWEYFGVLSKTPFSKILEGTQMPDIQWFPGAYLNYAEHSLRRQGEEPAIFYEAENGDQLTWSWDQLRTEVSRIRGALKAMDVRVGDRVAGYLPNIPQTVAAFLACASLGAIWSSCSPDFGSQAVLDRFQQIEPKILFAVDGYRYNGKVHDRRAVVRALQTGLPTVTHTIMVRQTFRDQSLDHGLEDYDLLESSEPLDFEAVEASHPLWILYSSGTTGLPKPIVQGHGGILLTHLAALTFHLDLGPDDRFMWFTTTGWMMWNIVVSGLLVGASIVLYDGNPAYPQVGRLWKIASEKRITFLGTSAAYIGLCQKQEVDVRSLDLSMLRAVGSTGSPLTPEMFEWVYQKVSTDLWLTSLSGGTDICSAVVGGVPTLPVRSGEIQCRYLGAQVEAFDEEGHAVYNAVGELVITQPLPSMPLFLWGDDAAKTRYRASYFDMFAGVWRHGDWILVHDDGSVVIYGRSDATINRGGIRMGTSEFYRVVEDDDRILDSLVVDLSAMGIAKGLILMVVVRPGEQANESLAGEITRRLRDALSPRHVPDRIFFVPAIPKTLNGKKMEIPVKKLLLGAEPQVAFNPGAMENPSIITYLVEQVRPQIG